MVYNTQNRWAFGITSDILKNGEHNVLETGAVCFRPQARVEARTLLDPLERANFSD
jgi:hypothetical protein